MLLPVKKCYFIIKLTSILIIIVTVLSLFEKWRGGRRKVGANTSPEYETDFERLIEEDEAKIIHGLGNMGLPAYLSGEDKALGDDSEKKLAINVHLSDRIAYNRTLSDNRNEACKRVVYSAELPSASIILIFHNEPYSVIVRTIWSVLNSVKKDQPWHNRANFKGKSGRKLNIGYPGQDPNSPYAYLKEIILVDDNSTLPELKGKLSHYVSSRLPAEMIRILRLPNRFGLIKARLAGARYASGDVLVFLDSHCEVQPDWLRPLLQRIKSDPSSVVVPIIDVIDSKDFHYSVQEPASEFQIGGFTFDGHFQWIDIPPWEKKRRTSDISPTWSPTMAGGLFAIDRNYFWSIGSYDEQMYGWGGENLEMSFRIWQCGGTLEIIPCSRVGHVFRAFHPYGFGGLADTHGINTARAALVWMDDYAELFFLHRPDLRNNPKVGDVTHRIILREKLKCKSFDWYLEHVYKQKYVPFRDSIAFGRFRNPISGNCLDTLQAEGPAISLGQYPCHTALLPSQLYTMSTTGQLRDESLCVTVVVREDSDNRLLMTSCHEGAKSQKFVLQPTGEIQHEYTGLCLTSGPDRPQANKCSGEPSQFWTQDVTLNNGRTLMFDSNVISAEQMKRLKKLPKLHRSSRSISLLSRKSLDAGAGPYRATNVGSYKRRSHAKRKRVRNNFLLKVLRSNYNDSDDHLEMSIFCKHKQLYPNNTFVRDIVTILNDNNIKVINKGRIFEKNKVTPLVDVQRVGDQGQDRPIVKSKRFKKVHGGKSKGKSQKLRESTSTEPTRVTQNDRIIVEDFVEVTVTEKQRKKHTKTRKKKKKNKRANGSNSSDAKLSRYKTVTPAMDDNGVTKETEFVEETTLTRKDKQIRDKARQLLSTEREKIKKENTNNNVEKFIVTIGSSNMVRKGSDERSVSDKGEGASESAERFKNGYMKDSAGYDIGTKLVRMDDPLQMETKPKKYTKTKSGNKDKVKSKERQSKAPQKKKNPLRIGERDGPTTNRTVLDWKMDDKLDEGWTNEGKKKKVLTFFHKKLKTGKTTKKKMEIDKDKSSSDDSNESLWTVESTYFRRNMDNHTQHFNLSSSPEDNAVSYDTSELYRDEQITKTQTLPLTKRMINKQVSSTSESDENRSEDMPTPSTLTAPSTDAAKQTSTYIYDFNAI